RRREGIRGWRWIRGTVPGKETTVSIVDIKRDLPGAVARVMDRHGVAEMIGRKPEAVYVKVNAIDFKPYAYTSLEVTGAVIDYCKEAGARQVYLMENSTQSNITRLVFHVTGFEELAREHGAETLYLDEGKQIPVELPHMGYSIKVSRHVKRIIDERDRVCYMNVPRLKTHSMTVLTAGIKNQYGLVAHRDRSPDHNFRLHRKIADIYGIIKPDFTLVDGTVATIYGHYPPVALHKKALVPFNILIGGTDTLAVDVVCARVLGYGIEEVEHLKEAWEMGLGCGDLEEIEVVGEPLDRFNKKYPCELYDAFPPDVEVIRGTERNCLEGCDANTMALLQVLYLDFEGKGGFTIVMGKGLDPEEIDGIEGRVFIAGPCAYDEIGRRLAEQLGKRNVLYTRECNDLANTTWALTKLMKVSPLKMVPISPVKSVELLIKAKLNRTTARIPPLVPL
ncbi:MAG: DUF362 domain-containing protein, partial [Actinobacteria bacterium]|nr:DUF362 domain-containing protein [Actinomycetota bacterium]